MIVNADAFRIPLADESVHCCITSPPYWGLRDYGLGENTLGLEPTPELYVEHMVQVFREIRRVLRKDGTAWLNLGDSYARNPGRGVKFEAGPSTYLDNRQATESNRGPAVPMGLKEKDLVGIPWRVAFALQKDGWWLRSDIVWNKPNPMPESVTDRPTRSHEYVFLLSKSKRYYYDADAIREAHSLNTHARGPRLENGTIVQGVGRKNKEYQDKQASGGWTSTLDGSIQQPHPAGRNKRTVWTVNIHPFKGAHFATFPPDLVEPMILAGCPKDGIALDPFCGSGTVGMVARKHGRRFVGLDLSFEYCRNFAVARGGGETLESRMRELPLFADGGVCD